EELGWIGSERPKMISVQAAGCAPIVKAWEAGKSASVVKSASGKRSGDAWSSNAWGSDAWSSEMWSNAQTFAAGLRVPKAYGDYLILDILEKSRGTAFAATDEEVLAGMGRRASVEGAF